MARKKKKKKPTPTDPGATNRQEPTEEPVGSRRSFLWKLWLAIGGVALLEYAWLSADFLRPRKPRADDEAGDIVVAGPLERFEPNSVTAFPQGKFYLARLGDGGLLAISRECTHLGCTVPWNSEEGRFVCPCHSSEYDITGDVLSPPAPRALDLFTVRIENGIVKVDTRARLRRTSFDAAQVARS